MEVAVEESILSSDWDPDLETASIWDPDLETAPVEPLFFWIGGAVRGAFATGMLLVLMVRVTLP